MQDMQNGQGRTSSRGEIESQRREKKRAFSTGNCKSGEKGCS